MGIVLVQVLMLVTKSECNRSSRLARPGSPVKARGLLRLHGLPCTITYTYTNTYTALPALRVEYKQGRVHLQQPCLQELGLTGPAGVGSFDASCEGT